MVHENNRFSRLSSSGSGRGWARSRAIAAFCLLCAAHRLVIAIPYTLQGKKSFNHYGARHPAFCVHACQPPMLVALPLQRTAAHSRASALQKGHIPIP
jgi:hypothetical protein